MTHFKNSLLSLYFPLICFILYFHLLYFSLKMLKAKPVTFKNQPNGASRKCKSLTAAQKKEIYLKKMSTSFLKQKELASEYDVSKGIIEAFAIEREETQKKKKIY